MHSPAQSQCVGEGRLPKTVSADPSYPPAALFAGIKRLQGQALDFEEGLTSVNPMETAT